MKLLRPWWLLLVCTSLARLTQAQVRPQTPTPTQRAAIAGRPGPDRASVRGVRDHLFALPEVWLANARVAARINRQLRASFWESLVNGASGQQVPFGEPVPATARQAVRRAQAYYAAHGPTGFTRAGYAVRHNGQGLLSLELTSGLDSAYPSDYRAHFTFDLRTGRRVTLRQLVTDTLALRRQWWQAVRRRVAPMIPDLLPGSPELAATLQQASIAPNTLSFHDFLLTDAGLVLYHDFDFPHVMRAGAPAADYRFPYAAIRRLLSPRGVLLLRPAKRRAAAAPLGGAGLLSPQREHGRASGVNFTVGEAVAHHKLLGAGQAGALPQAERGRVGHLIGPGLGRQRRAVALVDQ